MTDQARLFNPAQTAVACPVAHCQAIRLPTQDRVPTCHHDLDPERRHRPKGCLNAIDNSKTDIPF